MLNFVTQMNWKEQMDRMKQKNVTDFRERFSVVNCYDDLLPTTYFVRKKHMLWTMHYAIFRCVVLNQLHGMMCLDIEI